LDSLDALTPRGAVGVDGTNTAYFGGDAGRLFAYEDDAAVTWRFGADIAVAEAVLWVWSDTGSVTWGASADGGTWSEITPTTTVTAGNWERRALRFEGLPAGTRQLRMTFDPRAVAWTPQLGQLDVTLAPAAPTVVDALATDRRVVVTLPPDSTRVLRFER
jgi:hypothetical protein